MRRHGGWQRESFFGSLALLLILTPPAPSIAKAPPVVAVVSAPDACPGDGELVPALERALPGSRIVVGVGAGPAGAITVEVVDAGPRYLVRAGGQERVLVDEQRRCEERARSAAVFAALALDAAAVATLAAAPATTPDPIVGAPPVEASAPATGVLHPPPWTPPGSTTPPPRASTSFGFELAAAGIVAGAPRPGGGGPLLTGGGELRLLLGWRGAGIVIGAAGLAPMDLDFASARARFFRLPFDFSLRGAVRRGRVSIAGEVGCALDVLVATGVDLAEPNQSTRAQAGIRLAGELRLPGILGGRASPFAALSAEYFPVEQTVVVAPGRVVGTTPALWFSLSLGAALAIPWKDPARSSH